MDTPTSQAQANQATLGLESCLSQLAAGTFAFGQLPAFSDISRADVRRIAAVWPRIDHEVRRRLLAEAIDLGEQNVQFQFGRLCRLALTDPEPDIRQLAISGTWEDDSASLLDELIDIASTDQSVDVRAAAIARLGDALPAVDQGGDHADYIERIAGVALAAAREPRQSAIVLRRAIEAIGALDQTEETRSLIRAAWEHGDQTLEAGALTAMGRTAESHWLLAVRHAITSTDAELRFSASRALGQLGNSDDVPTLAERTLDDDSDVRLAAIVALGEIGGPGAVRVLRNLAKDAPESEAEVIEAALDYALLGDDPVRTST